MPASWLFRAGHSGRRIVRQGMVACLLALVGIVPSASRPAPAAAEAPGLATVTAETPLLAAAEPDAAVLETLAAGSEVILTGSAALGYLAVTVDSRSGWVAVHRLSFDSGAGISLADADLQTPILAAPLAGAEVLATVPQAGVVILTGANVGGYVAASYEGTGGWIAEAALGLPFDADHNAS